MKKNFHIPVTIIVPLKNEAHNILHLITDLENQTYQSSLTEVLFINDQSKDNTVDLIKYSGSNLNYRLIENQYPEYGKKGALTTGNKMASGSLILTTDGDCRLNAEWIQKMTGYYVNGKAKFLSGPVTLSKDKNLFNILQRIEFSSLIGTGAASIQAGMPNMCNGANIGYPKKIFEEINGYEGNLHYSSGDDEFLLQKIAKKYPDKVFFVKEKDAIVKAKANKNFHEFFHQRIRWAGKWFKHYDLKILLLAVFIFVLNASQLLILLIWPPFGLFLFIFRGVIEYIFLSDVCDFLEIRISLLPYTLLVIIYPLYAVFFGIAGLLGKFKWKN